MQTLDFETGLRRLIELAKQKRSALMCAEAVPWRCHRSLIADTLVVRGIRVDDIMSTRRSEFTYSLHLRGCGGIASLTLSPYRALADLARSTISQRLMVPMAYRNGYDASQSRIFSGSIWVSSKKNRSRVWVGPFTVTWQ